MTEEEIKLSASVKRLQQALDLFADFLIKNHRQWLKENWPLSDKELGEVFYRNGISRR